LSRWCNGSTILPAREPAEDPNAYGDLDEVTSVIGAFLGLAFTNTSNPSFVVTRPERPGIPDLDLGAKFDAIASDHLRFDALRELIQSTQDATALVMVPGIPLPIQPLMLREMDVVLPLAVSLQQSRRCRPLARAVILGDATMTSPWERNTVASLLRDAEVSVRSIPSLTREEFGELYCDEDLDLLWITSHGEYNHSYPDKSALVLGENEAVEMDWLASLAVPTGDRRLLVLNVCNGGHSAAHGGLYGFGIAPLLAGPSQTVISHLWPTAPAIAAAFGVVLAVELARGADHLEAFSSAVKTHFSGPDHVLDVLRARPGDGSRLAEHVSRSSHDLDNIAHWGSPTLHV
jgi:hypothetical protein